MYSLAIKTEKRSRDPLWQMNSPQSYWMSLKSGNWVRMLHTIRCKGRARGQSSQANCSWKAAWRGASQGGGWQACREGGGASTGGMTKMNLQKEEGKQYKRWNSERSQMLEPSPALTTTFTQSPKTLFSHLHLALPTSQWFQTAGLVVAEKTVQPGGQPQYKSKRWGGWDEENEGRWGWQQVGAGYRNPGLRSHIRVPGPHEPH